MMENMNFSYPEFSPAFKLLYTFSNLSYSQFPSPVFEKNKEDDFYTCNLIENINLRLKETYYKNYCGIVLEIYDLINETVMRSKFIKADFITFDNKKGYMDFDMRSIKSLNDIYPYLNGQLVSSFHYCSFANTPKNDTYTITIYPDNKLSRIRIGVYGASDLTKKYFKAYEINKALEVEHKKHWKEDFKKLISI